MSGTLSIGMVIVSVNAVSSIRIIINKLRYMNIINSDAVRNRLMYQTKFYLIIIS